MTIAGYPDAWLLADSDSMNGQDSSGSESEKEEIGTIDTTTLPLQESNDPSPVITGFLRFISFQATLNATQNFPAIILLILTIPKSLFSLANFTHAQAIFEAYWTAPISQPVLDSLLEVLIITLKIYEGDKKMLAVEHVTKVTQVLLGTDGSKMNVNSLVDNLAKLANLDTGQSKSRTIDWYIEG